MSGFSVCLDPGTRELDSSVTSDRPLAIDLFCGLGGWTEGLLAEGYSVIGFDIERHDYGSGGYPAQLVIQDVLTLHGSQFKDAVLIVASPPCQNYSYLAMPWSRSSTEHSQSAKALRRKWETEGPDNRLFDACFRIQREASEAAGRHIPMIVENVRGAIPWVGQSRWSYGSFHLWGDIPALMPSAYRAFKSPGQNLSVGGKRWCRTDEAYVMPDGTKIGGDRQPSGSPAEGIKHHGSGPIWFNTGQSMLSSRSLARKAASAQIAKIPFPLARHIARHFKDAAVTEARSGLDNLSRQTEKNP
jgi:hypothetical protein